MPLRGFDSEFRDFTDYILVITERIWEGRNIDAIRRYYAPDCIVHTPMGSVETAEAAVHATVETLHQFPDRQLLGEDVIWSGDEDRGLLSSHRIISTQTHKGSGSFGAPGGKSLTVRAIADCAARNNQIYEEWLVRDQSAIARQLGLDPAEVGRRWAAEDEAARKPQASLSFVVGARGPDTRELQHNEYAALVRDAMEAIWSRRDLSALARCYHRAVNLHLPGGVNAFGREQYDSFLIGYLASFPDAKLTIDHSVARVEPGRTPRVATRWLLTGTHSGTGVFGAPSGAPMFILGMTHSEIIDGKIAREWVLIDELAIWRRIARNKG